MLTITNTQVKQVMDIVEALVKGGAHLEEDTKVSIITQAINKALAKNQHDIDAERKKAEVAAQEKQKEANLYGKIPSYISPAPSGVTIVNNLNNDTDKGYSIDVSCLNGAYKSRTLLKKNQQVFVPIGNTITVDLVADLKNG